ncbi:RNA polymerase factor sigma-54 [Gallaecimonas kandeliae]|uniref:RNA polymerase factor sigma-54 n=1 Tax=Gallaecimonas kandeliae TaxID=3029055 RepID=UPI002649724D|nr:RNA polymerase factor sigma-54 [Gallaecimonas kandeliae]WKE67420.1 RNA polymerase factor sigma-54 [Gallaecimonas kandeliae]
MKPSLQLRIGQQLTMTPQLQQAIRLLQLSSLELQQEIQAALDANPLLEDGLDEEFDEPQAQEEHAKDSDAGDDYDEPQAEPDTADIMEERKLDEDLPVDASWDEVYSAGTGSAGPVSVDDDSLYQGETVDDIQQHLLWQMRLTPFTETDQAVAVAIIDAIDPDGYLRQSCEEILDSLAIEDLELDEVQAVLKRIQHFDPIGVAARDLKECLLIQLAQFAPDTPWLLEARRLIDEHIDLLGNRDYRTLMRVTKLKEDELREALRLIQGLNPRPGSVVSNEEPQYIIPDLSVTKKNGRWTVELNPDSMPRVRINQQYAAMSRNARNPADSQFIRSHLQEAKWFLKSLESRNDTLLKVARCIVQFQQGFFEYGEEYMKPMVLNDIAEAVDMHESTISRVTTQKYLHTPRGIFELKYFFSSHVATDDGGECSSTAIRAFIKKLVAEENSAKPLSDSKMVELLADQGIQVARRTIAKYREALGIPPSNQRKSLL